MKFLVVSADVIFLCSFFLAEEAVKIDFLSKSNFQDLNKFSRISKELKKNKQLVQRFKGQSENWLRKLSKNSFRRE